MTGSFRTSEIMDADGIQRSCTRIAHEILENASPTDQIALVGILSRGANLADRLSEKLKEISGKPVDTGYIDISFYRDDKEQALAPVRHGTKISFSVDNRVVIVVDDVLCTGRTVRAALDAIMDFGRPQRIQLAVLVDRGHRELPIRPDYVGKNVPSAPSDDVRVMLEEVDGYSCVELRGQNAGGAK